MSVTPPPQIGDTRRLGEDRTTPSILAPPNYTKTHICAVVDGPNADSVLGDIIDAKPGPDTRPDFAELYLWMIGDALGLDRPLDDFRERADEVDVAACFFLNFRTNTAQPITTFANYLVRNTPWGVGVLNTGDQVLYSKRNPDDERYDVDPYILDYLRDNTPTDPNNSHFYIMSNDFANVGEEAIELAREGHKVTIVCYTDVVGTVEVLEAGVRVVDYRDIQGIFKPGNIPPRMVDLSNMQEGEIRYFESVYR